MLRFKNRKFAVLLTVTPVLLVLQLIICVVIFSYIGNINQAEEESRLVDNYMRLNVRYITVAESGQRGYLLTHDSNYLKPYYNALQELKSNESSFNSLFAHMDTKHLNEVRRMSQDKLDELALTIKLHDNGKADSAVDVVKNGYGASVMDSIREETRDIRSDISSTIADMQKREFTLIYILLALITVMILFNIGVAAYQYKWVVTNTKRLEESIEELEKANGQLNDYTNMSYHELKTPLRSITGFLQLLRKKYSHQFDGEATEFVQYITEGVVQMNSTINDLRKQHLEKDN